MDLDKFEEFAQGEDFLAKPVNLDLRPEKPPAKSTDNIEQVQDGGITEASTVCESTTTAVAAVPELRLDSPAKPGKKREAKQGIDDLCLNVD